MSYCHTEDNGKLHVELEYACGDLSTVCLSGRYLVHLDEVVQENLCEDVDSLIVHAGLYD